MRRPRALQTAFSLALLTVSFSLSSSCRQVLDLPESVECGADDACTTADKPCIVGECIDGLCAYSFKAEGTVIDTAEEDDCTRNVCDGQGEVIAAVDASDAPADETLGDCKAPSCDADGNVTVSPAEDAPNDETSGDCLAPTCENGNVVDGPAEDAPADTVIGDCSAPGCAEGEVVAIADDGDVPNQEDPPGDCVSPTCSNGEIIDAPNELDVPLDAEPGNCFSPACDGGNPIEVENPRDTPEVDVQGDCLASTCGAGGELTPDDADVPTSGCGSCAAGVVVPWVEDGDACYSGPPGTENVGICGGGNWGCVNNVKTCAGEQLPEQEACGPGASTINEDCDGQTDEEGPGCACMIGQTQSCYSGPGGTLNVGICSAGTSTCVAVGNGNQFGACAGEVQPLSCDSCVVQGDGDCSGTSATCTGDHVWSKGIGGSSADLMSDILELPNGELVAVGSFSGSLTFANNVTSDGASDALVLRLDADGNAINARDFGGTASDEAKQLVALDDGYLVMGSLGDGSLENFGSGSTLTGVGGDGFVAKFNQNHVLQWKKLVGGTSADSIQAIVKMPDNGFAIAGQFQGTINLGGSNLVSLGFDDIFLARFDAAGDHVWSQRFGTNMQNNVSDLDVAPNGDLIMVGDLGTSMAFGGGPTINVAGGVDGYVVRFNQSGTHVWTRAIQSASSESASEVAVLSDGSVWVAGRFDTAINVNSVAGTELSPTSTGYDLFLVKYNASGDYVTSRGFNSTDDVIINDAEAGADDSVVVSGRYSGSLFFSQFAVPSAGLYDSFLFKVRPDNGTAQWSKKFGGSLNNDVFQGVHVTDCGDVFASGYFGGSVAFGGGALPNQGSIDGVLAKYRQ